MVRRFRQAGERTSISRRERVRNDCIDVVAYSVALSLDANAALQKRRLSELFPPLAVRMNAG
jgi:hypothetical protein